MYTVCLSEVYHYFQSFIFCLVYLLCKPVAKQFINLPIITMERSIAYEINLLYNINHLLSYGKSRLDAHVA